MMKIKLIKSAIGESPKAKKTLKALGLMKMNKVLEVKENPALKGMVSRVKHLVSIIKE